MPEPSRYLRPYCYTLQDYVDTVDFWQHQRHLHLRRMLELSLTTCVTGGYHFVFEGKSF